MENEKQIYGDKQGDKEQNIQILIDKRCDEKK